MEPLRRLTRPDVDFLWTGEQENALKEVKRLVTAAPVLAYFDHKLELEVQYDASKSGLGALLQQGRPIASASRTLMPTEQRYAQVEKEKLALEKFNHYTFVRQVKVQSTHKPLESILKKTPCLCSPTTARNDDEVTEVHL